MSRTALKLYGFCFLLLVLALPGRAVGQAVDPEFSSYLVGGWELTAVKDSQGEVMGLWGIPRVPVAVGNIRRLWFEAMPNDGWNVWAFEPVAMQSMIVALDLAGVPADSIDFLYYKERRASDNQLDLDIDGGVDGLVTKGFIDGDPLTESVGALSDPGPTIDLLAGVSYPIAPGISDLLVAGTSGSGVNMNQAFKQLLNCLRSTSSSCNDCVCVITESGVVEGPWEIIETIMPDGRLRCEYSRIDTHSYWTYGEFPDDCTDCSAGTPEDPITYTDIVEQTDYWLLVDHCPSEPMPE